MTFPTAEIDPNTVRPGWVALLIVLALGAATVLLWRNMRKQLKRIDFEPGADSAPKPPEADGPAGDAPATAARPTTSPTATDPTAPGPKTPNPKGTHPTATDPTVESHQGS